LFGDKSIKSFLLLLVLCVLVTACGENPEFEEVVVIDSAYLGSATTTNPPTTTTYSPVPYPIQIEDEIEIKVGEVFGYKDFNWESLFLGAYEISTPEIFEGEGIVCEISSDDLFSVLGKSPGSCSFRYPSTNGGNKGFIFLTINVTEG
jgi:hypothetical protein